MRRLKRKKAFRKQALKYHPDRNADIEAVDQFKAVNEPTVCCQTSAKGTVRPAWHRGLNDSLSGYRGSASDYQTFLVQTFLNNIQRIFLL